MICRSSCCGAPARPPAGSDVKVPTGPGVRTDSFGVTALLLMPFSLPPSPSGLIGDVTIACRGQRQNSKEAADQKPANRSPAAAARRQHNAQGGAMQRTRTRAQSHNTP